MYGWLSFLAGVCAFFGAFLVVTATSGLELGLGSQLQIALGVTLIVIAVIAAWLIYSVVRAQYSKVKTGMEALIGSVGVATTNLDPKGEIRVVGEFWEAIAKGNQHINAGQTVQVVGMAGMFLVVVVVNEKA